jgi:hypothetical protein
MIPAFDTKEHTMSRPSVDRRRVLSAALALPAAAVAAPSALAHPGADILARLANWDRKIGWANTSGRDPSDAELAELFALEDELYFMPCTSMAAAVAKLTMVRLSFERGERTDETEAQVIADVIAYLRSHAG